MMHTQCNIPMMYQRINCAPETYIMLLTNVTPIYLVLKKEDLGPGD